MIAVFTPNSLFDSRIGGLKAGYNIVEESIAQQWMEVTDKVREATPQEVAAYYKV